MEEDTYIDDQGVLRTFSGKPVRAPSLEQTVQSRTGIAAVKDRSTILPYSKELGWHVPEIIYGGIKSLMAPEQAYKYGNVTPQEAVETGLNIAGGGFGASSMMKRPTGIGGKDLGMQIGPGASKHWDEASAKMAQEALDKGVPPSQVKGLTGTDVFPMYQNYDYSGRVDLWGSKLFQEISDSQAKSKPGGGFFRRITDAIKDNPAPLKLNEVLEHPKLYEAYPQLQNVQVKYFEGPKNQKGYYDAEENIIAINKNIPKKDQHSTMLHEVQHNIQNIERWSGGSSPHSQVGRALENLGVPEHLYYTTMPEDDLYARFMQNKMTTQVEDEAFRLYQANQGEAAARATQNRRNLTDEELKRTPILYDVPTKDISPYKKGGAVEMPEEYSKGGWKLI